MVAIIVLVPAIDAVGAYAPKPLVELAVVVSGGLVAATPLIAHENVRGKLAADEPLAVNPKV